MTFIPPVEVRLIATTPGGKTVERSFYPGEVKPGDIIRAKLELTRRYGKSAVETVPVRLGTND